jgi:hypothetical protein
MKIIFDENMSKYLASGIGELQKGVDDKIEVVHSIQAFGKGAKDDEWIPEAAKMHAIVITQDANIARTSSLWKLCTDYKLGIFFVRPPSSYKYWDIVKFLIKKWAEMKEKAAASQRPYGFRVTPNKIERMLS